MVNRTMQGEYGESGLTKQIKVHLSSILDGASDRGKQNKGGQDRWVERDASRFTQLNYNHTEFTGQLSLQLCSTMADTRFSYSRLFSW